MIDKVLTRKFCHRAVKKFHKDMDSLTATEARYISYFLFNEEHKDECVPEGTIMRLTCDNPLCVAPEHIIMVSPYKQ